MKKIRKSLLILGDSLCFGRPNHGILKNDTWPYLVQNFFDFDMCFRANGGSTIIDLVKEARRLRGGWFKDYGNDNEQFFDYVIVQIGICDVTPRLISKRFYSRLKWLPYYQLMHRQKILYKIFGRPWVKLNKFDKEVNSLVKILKCFSKNIIFIEIAPPVKNLLLNVGDFSENVRSYNQVFSNLETNYLNCWSDKNEIQDYFLNDGAHFSNHGHQYVFNLLKNFISR